jgi:hypothetical protein
VEQPTVTFTGKIFGEFLFYTGSNNNLTQYYYSTLKPIKNNLINILATPDIKSSAVDLNNDGVIDQYNISLRIKKPWAGMTLSRADLILAFNYELKGLLKMKMEGLAVVTADSLSSISLGVD